MEEQVPERLTVLGHPARLAIFRLLMRRYPDAVPAGEIGAALDMKPSTLSAYLAALARAGLVTQRRSGTSLRYAIAMEAVRHTLDTLLLDCCRGRPDLCSPLPRPDHRSPGAMSKRRYNVLFLCTGNSARSIFAEAILAHEAGDRFNAFSAGTRPYSNPSPFALEVLAQTGHQTGDLRSKSITEFQGPGAVKMDFVFTVCNQAANEDCPPWEGQPVSAHWGMPDPAKIEGSHAEMRLAFQQSYGMLRNRILAFTALPIAELDRISLQRAVDEIGREEARAPV